MLHIRTDIYTLFSDLQTPLLKALLIALNAIADFESIPAVKANTALCVFAHLLDIFLLVFERGHHTCYQWLAYHPRYHVVKKYDIGLTIMHNLTPPEDPDLGPLLHKSIAHFTSCNLDLLPTP
jgi:hypothetical protein